MKNGYRLESARENAYLRQVGNSRMCTSLLDISVWQDGGNNLTFRGHMISSVT